MKTKNIFIFLIFFATTIFAAPKVWTGKIASSFDGGSGTESDPYLVATAEQFALMASSSDTATFYKLTEDIVLNEGDASEWAENPPANQWTVYGTLPKPVHKYIDGNSHKVSGIYVNSTDSLQGLFGLFIGSISDLSLTNGYVKGGYLTGGLVGLHYCADRKKYYTTCGLFRDTVDIYVEGDDHVGGIAGNMGALENAYSEKFSMSDWTRYEDLVFKGSITGNHYVGGIAAVNTTSMERNNAYNISNYGKVTGKRKVGGLFGKSIMDVPNASMLQSFRNFGTVEGDSSVGGIVGYFLSERINKSYEEKATHGDWINFGNVKGIYDVGGIAGTFHRENGNFSLRHSYNVGQVTGIDSVGGVIGGHYIGWTIEMKPAPKDTVIYTCLNFGEVIKNGDTIETKKSIKEANAMLNPTRYAFIADETGNGENFGYPIYIPKYKKLILPNGSGTVDDPYLIENEKDLYGFAIMSSLDSSHMRKDTLYFLQTKDIEWTGKYGEWHIDSLLLTEYNGGNHTISGIKIKQPELDSVGFVRFLKRSSIVNLTIKDFEVEGRDFVGLIAGDATNSSFLHNIHIYGNVKGNNNVGGIAGVGSVSTTNVISHANVTGQMGVGGLYGKCYANMAYSVSNAHVIGDSLVGGICGYTSYNQVSLHHMYSIANVEARTHGSMVMNNLSDDEIRDTERLFYKQSHYDKYPYGTELSESFMKSDAFLDSLPLTFVKDSTGDNNGFPIPFIYKGNGSGNSPYLIESAKDMHIFNMRHNRINEKSDWISTAFFKLTSDIDMNQNKDFKWKPIPKFYGEIDGDYHVISNMRVEQDTGTVALFKEFYGRIKNMGISNSTFKGYRAAAFAGHFEGIMTNSWNENTSVYGVQHASGIVQSMAFGSNASDSRFGPVLIDRVYNTGKVTSDSNTAAAIVARVDVNYTFSALDTSRYLISNVYNRAEIISGGIDRMNVNQVFGEVAVSKISKYFKFAENYYTSQVIYCEGEGSVHVYATRTNNYSIYSKACLEHNNSYNNRKDTKTEQFMKTAEFAELLGDAFEMDTANINDGFPILKGLKPRTSYKNNDSTIAMPKIATNVFSKPALHVNVVGREMIISGIKPGSTLKVYDMTGTRLLTTYATRETINLNIGRSGMFIVRNNNRIRVVKII